MDKRPLTTRWSWNSCFSYQFSSSLLTQILLLWNLCTSHLPWIGNVSSCMFKVPVLCQASVGFPDSSRQASCLFKDVSRHPSQSLSWTFNSSIQEQDFSIDWTFGWKYRKLWHAIFIFIKITLICCCVKEACDLICY